MYLAPYILGAARWLLEQAGGKIFTTVTDKLAIKMGFKSEQLTTSQARVLLDDYLQHLEDRLAQRVIARLDEDRLILLKSAIDQLKKSSNTKLREAVLSNALNGFSHIINLPEQGDTGGFSNAQLRSVAFLGIAAIHMALQDSDVLIAENVAAAIYADSSTAERWFGKELVQELLKQNPISTSASSLSTRPELVVPSYLPQANKTSPARQLGPRRGSQKWSFSTGGGVYSSPTVVNGIVYVGSRDGKFYALDAASGRQRWSFYTADVDSSPTVSNSVVYVGSDSKYFWAFDAISGQQKWNFCSDLGERFSSSPTVVNDVVYVCSDDGYLWAIDVSSGRRKGYFRFDSYAGRHSSPTVVNNVIYASSISGKLYALNTTSIQIYSTTPAKEKWSFCPHDDMISSSPTVVNGVVYVGSSDGKLSSTAGKLYALDAASGRQKWSFPTGGNVCSSPAVDNGVVYFGSWDGWFYALDATSGRQRWSFPTGGPVYSSPFVVNGIVYVGSKDYNLYALDAASGQQKWSFSTSKEVLSSPTVVDEVVYVGSLDHNLYAIFA